MSGTARDMGGWRGWLATEEPSSRRQAQCGRLYRGALSFLDHRIAVVGLAIVTAFVLVAVLAPVLAPYSAITQDLMQRLKPPNSTHWLGTDELGRDIFSRLIWGARITLSIVLMVSAITAPIGLLVGCCAGYFGGWADAVLMRFTDVFLALPRLILALAFVAALGPGIGNAVLAITLVAWPPYARVARAETIALRHSEFIEAARVAGASSMRIVFRHLMPLCLPSVIVRMSLDMAGIILTAAGLGFLGLGAQPPSPEWGAMIATGRKFMIDQWWVAAMPGIAIALVSFGFNLLGDGLRDWLDPKQR